MRLPSNCCCCESPRQRYPLMTNRHSSIWSIVFFVLFSSFMCVLKARGLFKFTLSSKEMFVLFHHPCPSCSARHAAMHWKLSRRTLFISKQIFNSLSHSNTTGSVRQILQSDWRYADLSKSSIQRYFLFSSSLFIIFCLIIIIFLYMRFHSKNLVLKTWKERKKVKNPDQQITNN